MESVERDYEIELVPEGKAMSVRHLESKIRPGCGTEMARSEANHVLRRIDTYHCALWHASGDLRGNPSVTASDIEDPLRTFKIEQSEHFLGHCFLECRLPRILSGIPFGHIRHARHTTTLLQTRFEISVS